MSKLISRRYFLNQAGIASAVGLIGSRISASAARHQPKTGGVHLAIATICTDGFGNKHHEPAFRVIPELGFKNVEFNLWYADQLTPQYIDTIRHRCYATGLTPICLQGTGFGGEGSSGVIMDLSHKMILLDRCEQLGCRIIKCTGSRRGTSGGLEHIIEVCKELAPIAEEMDMLVTLENHASNVLENIGDYEEVFAAIDSSHIGMCMDIGHFEGIGVDLHEVIDKFHDRILHVDLKDCRARGKGHDTVVFGQGVTDFDSILTHLMEKNYQGYLVVEQAWREPQGDWQSDLAKSYQLFKRWES
ncbi:MAG: sugar phosphate isomerase/epimerase [Verrucomicrobiae bacterium]|nr:sugar phosphate isomerase/epimerase [Verrucomicrobiae bacterium]